jgi:hypothetical protein
MSEFSMPFTILSTDASIICGVHYNRCNLSCVYRRDGCRSWHSKSREDSAAIAVALIVHVRLTGGDAHQARSDFVAGEEDKGIRTSADHKRRPADEMAAGLRCGFTNIA